MRTMPTTTITALKLHEEAARCERLAYGVSSPELIARLLRWAAEYRRDATLLARV